MDRPSGPQRVGRLQIQNLSPALQTRTSAAALSTLPARAGGVFSFAWGFGGLLGLFPSLSPGFSQVQVMVCFPFQALVVISEYG